MPDNQLEEQIRAILHETDDVFKFAAVHGYKWKGGDLTPKIMEAITQQTEKAEWAGRVEELKGFLERTVHKDKKPGDLDKDGNPMKMMVSTGYNYAKAEMRHDIKDRLEQLSNPSGDKDNG